MRIVLTDMNIIPLFIKGNKKNFNNEYFINYAKNICDQLFGDISLHHLEKIGIDRFETVFIGSKAFSAICLKKNINNYSKEYKMIYSQVLLLKNILKGKPIYICRLTNVKGYFEFSFPELVCFELSNSTSDNKQIKKIRKKIDKANTRNVNKKPLKINNKKIQAYLIKININSLKNLINLAKRDFDFVERFNNEMFHQNISYNGRILTRDEIKLFYETEHFMKIIDLSDIRERIAFVSLYGIAIKGLELRDFYSVDGIFSLQPNRELDIIKQLSGSDVFYLIINREITSITQAIIKMGEALLKIPIPLLDLNDYNLLKQNYSLYCGIADIGRLFLRIIIPELGNKLETYHRTAARMIDFLLIEHYFDYILKYDVDVNFDLGKNRIYETLTRFESAIKDKKITAELNHGNKEFKL